MVNSINYLPFFKLENLSKSLLVKKMFGQKTIISQSKLAWVFKGKCAIFFL